MSEANQNANSETFSMSAGSGIEQPDQITDRVKDLEDRDSSGSENSANNSSQNGNKDSSTTKMNWQRVAHKLREYNRKLLKKVFRLEQELAEIDNKFNKHIEKSQNSDVLLVKQAEAIESDRQQIAQLLQQLSNSQQQIDSQELVIQQVTEQHNLSQQQAAQLERECTLLQEKYNQKAFEMVVKEQEVRELQCQLSQQQHNALQQEAELKRYQEAASRKEKATNRNQNYPHNRFIQPWSTTTIPEPKIALAKTKQFARTKKVPMKTSETIKTAAEIATWSAATSTEIAKKTPAAKVKAERVSSHKKPRSLAAVDLPTFPRPQ